MTLGEGQGERRYLGAPPGHYVMLSVADTGTGMDKATLARLFEPFFTTKPRTRGTGFGLFSVYGFVKQAGGDVSVESEVGKGTTFRLFLSPAAAGGEVTSSATAGGSPGVGTVLVVEDEGPVRLAVVRMLSMGGYEVLSASGGAEALEICRSHDGPIDLVLSDVAMPQMTGPAFVERMRGLRPATKVVLMSGHATLGETGVPRCDAAVPFLSKPFTSDVLLQKLRDVLDAGAVPPA